MQATLKQGYGEPNNRDPLTRFTAAWVHPGGDYFKPFNLGNVQENKEILKSCIDSISATPCAGL